MKKLLFTLAVMLITTMALNSCGDDDEPAANFQVPEVCHTWGASRDEARQQMEKYGWTYTGDEGFGMNFEIKRKNIICTLGFGEEGKLSIATVFYIGMYSFFDELKSILTKRFNIVNWKTHPQYNLGETADKSVVVTMYPYYNETLKADCMAYQLIMPDSSFF